MKAVKCSTYIKKQIVNHHKESPVYFRITVNGILKTVSSEIWVNQKRWETTDCFKQTRDSSEKEIRIKIDQFIKKVEVLVSENEGISCEQVVNEINGKNEIKTTITLNQLFDKHKIWFDKQVSIGVITKDTYKKYRSVQAQLNKYLVQEYHIKDIALVQIDNQFQLGYHSYLRGVISHNTAIKYVFLLRSMVKFACDNGLLKVYPFNHYKMSEKKVKHTILSLDEVNQIADKEFKIERLEKVRDVFIFCCFTGLSFIDVFNLKKSDITLLEGEKVIVKERQKTGVQYFIPLLPAALDLIEKYSDDKECAVTGKVFPVNTNQRMNAYLKEIKDCCGISKKLNMHVARFSFATIALNAGIPATVVQSMVGHSRLQQTMEYATTLQHTIINESKRLSNKFGSAHLKIA